MDSIASPTRNFGYDASRERMLVVTLVVALHLAVLLVWMAQPENVPAPEREMEVTVAVVIAPAAQPEAPQVPPLPKPVPALQPHSETHLPQPAEPVVWPSEIPPSEPSVVQPSAPAPAHVPVVAAAPVIAPSEPVVPDVEPDYKAGYLNNPRPPYPFAARRMGLHGKVVLNVEVLAEGLCGQANVHQSSGHEMLDNAALQTVKTWKFIPARQAGHAITRWFKIPIQFSLNNNET